MDVCKIGCITSNYFDVGGSSVRFIGPIILILSMFIVFFNYYLAVIILGISFLVIAIKQMNQQNKLIGAIYFIAFIVFISGGLL